MSGMYLRECLIENIGPMALFDVSFGFDAAGNPKPVILVGKNGTGKTIVLAYILDALSELAKRHFTDVVVGPQRVESPFIKLSSSADCRSLCGKSVCLLEFSDSTNHLSYVEKIGDVDGAGYATRVGERFRVVQSWPARDADPKNVVGDKEQIASFFGSGAVCFFPSSRHEPPHWLNPASVKDEPLFRDHVRIHRDLGKPLIVERVGESTRQWIMDVLLDSLFDGEFVPLTPLTPVFIGGQPQQSSDPHQLTWMATSSNVADKHLLAIARHNVETVLRRVLEDASARLVLNYRADIHGRVAIHLANGVIVPSLKHLSAGQSVLFNMFSTIIRYADRADLHKSIRLHEIEGLVLIDEIDAHLHTDLQYEVLPRLIKLFPRVQFIVTSHAPLFLLGMEREFGTDGVQILEMPTGQPIGTERFEEFRRSFEYYRKTKAFEVEIETQVRAGSKPLVLTEGQTDVAYIRTALEVLGHSDLLEQLEIDEVGRSGSEGTRGGGHKNLDAARSFLENNQTHFSRSVLFLYDCDTKKKAESIGRLLIRTVPETSERSRAIKGIENLLPTELFEDRFYLHFPRT
jgi:AAA domain, putative AbiEii toxin, Type IV TA system